jgi:CubicO group peptidase (beta-lactamase class C family)
MVFSATKGMASTVIHRLADRGLIDCDTPVAHYWPQFAANGKAELSVRQVMHHQAGLSSLRGATLDQLLDHFGMEERLAGSPTRAAEIIAPQNIVGNPLLGWVMRRAAHRLSGAFRSMYFRGATQAVRGQIPLLDAEIPAANGVVTARTLARMYGAIANHGEIDGTQFLSSELVAGLTGQRDLSPDRNLVIPLSFNLGYHRVPFLHVMPGFGHVGLGGSLGWADPSTGLAFAFVHNRLLSPLVMTDHAGFVGISALLWQAAATAKKRGFEPVSEFGAPYSQAGAAAG